MLKRMLVLLGSGDDPQAAAALAWTCVTVPGSVSDPDQVVWLAERAAPQGGAGRRTGRSRRHLLS